MGSTYLQLTNKVIRKLNEVELTSSTFASASGFHALVKDAVNYAINDINQAQYRWPFNHADGSETMVADQQEYSLPSTAKVVDWSTFFLERDDSLSVNPQTIRLIDYNEWNNQIRSGDILASGTAALPQRVFRTRDGKFGISPIPDRAYTVSYEYWIDPVELSAHGDTTTIPSVYDKIIISGAIRHAYDFRENYEMSGKEYSIYKQGLKQMRSIEINDSYEYAYDTRSPQVTSRRSPRWAK